MKRRFWLVLAALLVGGFAFAQAKATLMIMCNVAGAQVFVSGQVVGSTNPNLRLQLKPGNYDIRVSKQGYVDFQTRLAVGAKGATIRVVLQPASVDQNAPAPQGGIERSGPPQGVDTNAPAPAPTPAPAPRILNFDLTISANISGADVYINGNPAGKTPFRAQVPAGSYSVQIKAPGFVDYNQDIVVGNGPAQIAATLQGQNYQVSVNANVNGADVYINGNLAGKTPFRAQVPAGSYSIQIRAAGYVDYNQNIVVGNGPAQINASLQSLSYQVSVNANVNGALVFINGQQVGQTPYAAVLMPGSYTLLVRAAGYLDYQAPLNVGGPTAVNASLQMATASWQLRIPEGLFNKEVGQGRGIQLWIDGAQQNLSRGQASGQILPGKHVVRIAAGELLAETQVDIQLGKNYVFEPFLGISIK